MQRVLHTVLILAVYLHCFQQAQGRSVLEANVAAAASVQQQSGPPGPGYAISRPTFVVFGDSITEFGYNGPSGWVTLLSQYYSRKADIINRGMSGWNTRWAAEVLPATLDELVPAVEAGRQSRRDASRSTQAAPWLPRLQLLVIWFGANDAVLPDGKDGFLHVPLDEYKANLGRMVSGAREAGVPHILLLTPPPVNEAAWAKAKNMKSSDRTNAQVAQYAAAVKQVASGMAVPVLDMNGLVNGLPVEQRSKWHLDGVHPGPEGQAMVFNAIKNALDNWDAFRGLRQSVLPVHWPPYNAVNYKWPKQTFDELFDKQRVVPPGNL